MVRCMGVDAAKEGWEDVRESEGKEGQEFGENGDGREGGSVGGEWEEKSREVTSESHEDVEGSVRLPAGRLGGNDLLEDV